MIKINKQKKSKDQHTVKNNKKSENTICQALNHPVVNKLSQELVNQWISFVAVYRIAGYFRRV